MQGTVRAVCAIIDAFHFKVQTDPDPSGMESGQTPLTHAEAGTEAKPEPAQLATPDAAAEGADANSVEADAEAADEAEEEADAEAAMTHADIQAALPRRVLPTLRGQLVQDGEVRR